MTKKEALKQLLIFYTVMLALIIPMAWVINRYFSDWLAFLLFNIPAEFVPAFMPAASLLAALGVLVFAFILASVAIYAFLSWRVKRLSRL